MRLTRCVLLALVVALAAAPVARADDMTPVVPQPTVAAEPTQAPAPVPPVADTPEPVVVTTPEPTAPPSIPVAPEQGHAVEKTQAPVGSTTTSESAPSATEPRTAPSVASPSSPAPVQGPASHTTPTTSSPGISGPPAVPVDTAPPDVTILTGTTQISTAASAPAQLSCTGKPRPVSGPFLSSPYAGWSEINSFVDHDDPDYAVDGKIVLANGLVAEAGAGQASDVFPAYWSSALRQYVNYDGHNGYDFGISYQPLLAAAPGTVKFAGWNSDDPNAGYGQMVLIDHHNGYVTLYGHLSKIEVKKGETVQAGQEIGISGSTGNSTGPHLHFSVFHNCQVTDPYGWTGKGKDPLESFNGEQSAYLWLPGHDPLVLNPPPGWPSYPVGLRVALPWKPGKSLPARVVPPVGRLLLLSLPLPDTARPTSPGVAVARTTAVMTEEEEALIPYLNDLESQGLIDSYQAIPSAAAIWTRGIASASQLESLPGVASLSGGQPRDVQAAEIGLAHSVLIQLGARQAPSLWPLGFRSALHPWRPVAAVVRGHALVAGFGLPGQNVEVTLRRQGRVFARGRAIADPQSGGFVATLIDLSGRSGDPEAGDALRVSCAGRVAGLTVGPLTLKARSRSLRGTGPGGSPVDVALVGPDGALGATTTLAPSPSGRFAIRTRSSLFAGTMGVASTLDGAGDQQADTSVVPGAEAELGGTTIQGWATGQSPTIKVFRRGKLVALRSLKPTRQGYFLTRLHFLLGPPQLEPGDTLHIGSAKRYRVFTLPRVSLDLKAGGRSLLLQGRPDRAIQLTARDSRLRTRSLVPVLKSSGKSIVRWPFGRVGPGDSAEALVRFPSGDAMVVRREVTSIELHEATANVLGVSRPGSPLTFQLFSPHRKVVARAFATSDPLSGKYSGSFADGFGRPMKIEPGETVVVTAGGSSTNVRVPNLGADPASGVVEGPPNQSLTVAVLLGRGQGKTSRLKLNRAGKASLALGTAAATAKGARLQLALSIDATTRIVHNIPLQNPHTTPRRARP